MNLASDSLLGYVILQFEDHKFFLNPLIQSIDSPASWLDMTSDILLTDMAMGRL